MDNGKNALVSVGIPTFNRPQGLRRTLDCITQQSYGNLEIIISDNCSPTTETQLVAHEFMRIDSRVRYVRQIENIGATRNILSVLEQATGEYFMWAADDDEWDPKHIESLVSILAANDHVSVAHCQTRYKLAGENVPLPFFLQGAPLNSLSPHSWTRRLRFAAQENFGELFYGIYRRDVLMGNNAAIDFEHSELIHAGLKAMIKGDVYVSREVTFTKCVTEEAFLWTYLCAKDKCAKAKNVDIERMLEQSRAQQRHDQVADISTIRRNGLKTAIRALFRKVVAMNSLARGSIGWHWLYFKSAAYTINNIELTFWKKVFVKLLIAKYLLRSVVWTIAMKLK